MGVFAGNEQARTSLVLPHFGQNHWIFLISAGPPPPKKNNKHLRTKKDLNTLQTMRTGCEASNCNSTSAERSWHEMESGERRLAKQIDEKK